jgi:diguanylate cyclase (GGDEF)-like protein
VTDSLELGSQGHALCAGIEAAKRLLSPLSEMAALEEILNQIESLFRYPISAVLLVDETSHALRVMTQRGYDPEAARLVTIGVAEPGISGDGFPAGGEDDIGRIARDPRYAKFASAARSHVAFPLAVDGEVLGVLTVGSREADAFPEEARRALEAFAGLAALAILRAQQDDELQRLAMTDGLTNLANYRALVGVLDREIAMAAHRSYPLSIVVLEIDKFKRINDRYGHLRGDEVLRAVGNVLRGNCRKTDLAARFGGDEFMLLLPHTSQSVAAQVAERARRQVEGLVLPDDIHLTVSLGVANMPDAGDTADALLDAADRTMYRVKNAGGNRVGVFLGDAPDATSAGAADSPRRDRRDSAAGSSGIIR